MKSKNMTLMVVAIGCGLVAAFLTARLSGGSGPEMVDVIVAKKELVVGTLLDEKELENMLATQKVQKSNLPPDIINNADELKGKKLNRTLKAGNFFSTGDVGADSGIKLPEGMSKYAIKMDGVKAVAGFVQAGDKVDVILTESQGNKTKSGMILRDMLVLAVDTSARRREGGEAIQQVNSVSLAVTSTETLTLASAEKRGEVRLVLRDQKSGDKTIVAASTNIPLFDTADTSQQPAAPPVKTVAVIVAKADVPVNTLVTTDNFDMYFGMKDLREEDAGSLVTDRQKMLGKYVTNKMAPQMFVFNEWLSNDKPAEPKQVVMVEPPAHDELEILPPPHELAQEKPLYPRKFEQILNGNRVFFIEIAPGQFRRVDGNGADLKDLPETNSKPEKKDEKADEKSGDRAA